MNPEEPTPPTEPEAADPTDHRPPVTLTKMKLPKPEKKPKEYGVVTATSPKKKHELHVTVWPEGAGEPYPLAVEPDDQGWFYLDKKQMSPKYRIRPGTVLYHNGRYTAWIKEGYFETLDPRDLGKGPHPDFVNGLIKAGVLSELEGLIRRGLSGWQTAGIVSFGVLALAIIGVMVWAVIDIGGSLDAIRAAIDSMDITVNTGSTDAAGAGHQDISPE